MGNITKKMTIKDIADIAGVSKSTVSRVLDGNPRISEETRKRVFEIINKYGYNPNAAARNLARQKTHAVGIVMPHGESEFYCTSFFQELLKGICSTVTEYNYDVLLTTGNPSESEAISRLISTSKVDGIILLRSNVDDENIKMLLEEKFPFVLIGTCLEKNEIYSVDNDNIKAAYDLTGHMLEAGKKRIAFIGGNENAVFTVMRLEGYKKCLMDNSININTAYIKVGQFMEECGYNSMKELMTSAVPPDAVIVMDDTICMGAMRYLEEIKARIPEDIAVACFNDSVYTRYSRPSITAVTVDSNKLGMSAAETLLEVLNNKEISYGCKFIDYEILKRESTSAT